ncbi:MAG: cation transporter [Phycisphaerales bacterium]|nr:cation transporter [Phycisphaerales bacterium]
MNSSDTPFRDGAAASVLALLVNACLGTGKLVAGILGNSFALVADAVESLLDLVSSAVVLRGLHIAGQPADDDHPYGHGRAESLAGLIVALLVFGTGVSIAVESVRGLFNERLPPAGYTLFVLLGVVVVKEGLFRFVRRVGRKIDSGSVEADAWHHRSDAITSLAAAVGIAVALLGGPAWAHADNWAALVAAGLILFNATRLVRRPLRELMDTQAPEIGAAARLVARAVPGVADIEKVYARKVGLHYLIDMHVEVDGEMSVRHSHEVAHEVDHAVRAVLPQVRQVLVHVEPHRAGEQSTGD